MVRIGTSGWVYKHWHGSFYPPDLRQKDWFKFYSQHYDTVEINNSFYRLPADAAFTAWRMQAPPGFVYAVKASRYITHLKKLIDPQEPVRTFFERAQELGPHLGPVLFQLPPYFPLNLERLAQFLAALPANFCHVIEFRDQSWLVEPVFDLMEQHGVAHCIHDMQPLQVPVRVTAQTVYLRFHGAHKYSGDYHPDYLRSWAERIVQWEREGREVYAYFNNDIGGWAIKNARELREFVRALEITGPSS